MKIFGRGGKEEAAAAPAPPAPERSELSLTPTPSAEPSAPAQPSADLANILDTSVKDISEKIARLAASVETVHKDRASFDDKLKLMEDRMRKLSSLTEVMSSQYNPFVGDEPHQEESRPRPGSPTASAAAVNIAPQGNPSPGPTTIEVKTPRPQHAPRALPVAAPALHPIAAAATGGLSLDEDDDDEPAWSPPKRNEATDDARLTTVPHTFEASLLMMSWCDALLRAASREGLDELLHYYQTIGWINDAVREHIENYANGIASPPSPTGDWRANIDLHQRSLLFVEKLRLASGEDRRQG